eukprot:6196935-Pleurochrysis_carterae.AAC.2
MACLRVWRWQPRARPPRGARIAHGGAVPRAALERHRLPHAERARLRRHGVRALRMYTDTHTHTHTHTQTFPLLATRASRSRFRRYAHILC